jgi:hypothetical protein
VNKKVPVVKVAQVETASLAGLPLETTVALADLAGADKEGLLDLCADVGLMVMAQMLDADMTARVGPKHAKIPGRQAHWHGTTDGPVVLSGRQVTVTGPGDAPWRATRSSWTPGRRSRRRSCWTS